MKTTSNRQGEKTMFVGVALIVATLLGAIMGVTIPYTPLIMAGCAGVIMGAILTVKEER